METPLWVDTTLRDGIQAPGIRLSLPQKKEIFTSLLNLGLRSLEIGIPIQGPDEQEFITWCTGHPGIETIAWCRLKLEDLEASFLCNSTTIHLAVPGGQAYRNTLGHFSDEQILRSAGGMIRTIRKGGQSASLGVEDAPHCDPGFLRELLLTAQESGASRVRIADSLGSLTPRSTGELITPLADLLVIPLEFHGHNDLGMASANAYTAWQSGARALSTTLGGVGERGGHTALEEVAAAVELLAGKPAGLNWMKFRENALRIFEILEIPIPDHKPLLGSRIHEHEAGLHIDILTRGGQVSSVPPEFLGCTQELRLSPQAGRRSLEYFARLQGFNPDRLKLDDLLKQWKNHWKVQGVLDKTGSTKFGSQASPEEVLRHILEKQDA